MKDSAQFPLICLQELVWKQVWILSSICNSRNKTYSLPCMRNNSLPTWTVFGFKDLPTGHIYLVSSACSGAFIKLWYRTGWSVSTGEITLIAVDRFPSWRWLAVARSTQESNQVPQQITAFLKSFLIIIITGTSLSQWLSVYLRGQSDSYLFLPLD